MKFWTHERYLLGRKEDLVRLAENGQGRPFLVSHRPPAEHIIRLEKVFDELYEAPSGETCDTIKLRETTLAEEKNADEPLTKLAETEVNRRARAA
jgi:ferritin-like metal-binding protein YciE